MAVGTVAVSFASTIGATLACAVSRFLLRDWVQNTFGDKLATINAGIKKEGATAAGKTIPSQRKGEANVQ